MVHKLTAQVKRIYEPPAADDGFRVLVDRVWPRGVRKDEASLHEWAKALAPSTELRKWFNHDPARWEEFRQRYRQELAAPELAAPLQALRDLAQGGRLTLLYGAKDQEHNQARVLAEVLG